MRQLLATITASIAILSPTTSIAAPIYPSAENPIANAWILESANCRRSPSLSGSVTHEFPKLTPVSIDIRTAIPGVTIGRGDNRWMFEYSRSCWIHESRVFWMGDGDPQLNKILPNYDR